MTQPYTTTLAHRLAMRQQSLTVVHRTETGEEVEIPAHVRTLGVILVEPTLAEALELEKRFTVRDPDAAHGVKVVWKRFREMTDEELQQEGAYHKNRFDAAATESGLRGHYRYWRATKLVLAARAVAQVVRAREA